MPLITDLEDNKVNTAAIGHHRVYVVISKYIINASMSNHIERWSGNRKADPMRVNEIRKYMQETKRCPGTICLAEIGNKVVCYDGNHRREALVPEVEYVLVDVMHNATESDVNKEFRFVNDCVMVPDMYVENSIETATDTTVIPHGVMKKAIEGFVFEFCKKYKTKQSSSMRCHRPRFNRDVLTQNICDAYIEFKGDIKTLFDNISVLNRIYEDDSLSLSENIRNECMKDGLWLFARDRGLSIHDLRKVYNGELCLSKY